VLFVYGIHMDWRIELSVKDEDENLIPYVLLKNSNEHA